MPTEADIREQIQQIAQSPRNVRLDDIRRVVKGLGAFHQTSERRAKESVLFRVEDRVFSVCAHNRNDQHLKVCYVRGFLDAMEDLGWYDEE